MTTISVPTPSHILFAEAFLPTPLENGLNRLAAGMDELEDMRELLTAACDVLNLNLDERETAIIETVSDLARKRHVGVFHGPAHFREVVACTAFLIDRCGQDLSAREKFLLLVTAASHDPEHDGTSNILSNIHIPFRLEDKSFAAVASFLYDLGMQPGELHDMHALIRATDTSRNAAIELLSPARKIQLLDHAVLKPVSVTDAFNAPDPFIDAFRGRPNLWRMAVILQAADILPSAALSLSHSAKTSQRLETENGMKATAGNFAWFAEHIAGPAFQALPTPVGLPLFKRMMQVQTILGQPAAVFSVPTQGLRPATYRPVN